MTKKKFSQMAVDPSFHKMMRMKAAIEGKQMVDLTREMAEQFQPPPLFENIPKHEPKKKTFFRM